MEEVNLSRDYRGLWKAARNIKNLDQMDLIFNTLCTEIGLPDPERDQRQAEVGKALAEQMNSRGKGPEAKKI
jgi:hypothetical protein